MSEEIIKALEEGKLEFGEPIEQREGNFIDGYKYGIYKALNIIDNQQEEIERLIISLQAQEELTINEHIKVERLNNIINELEEYSEKMISEYNEAIEYSIDNIDRFNLLGARSSYREISNKIKELKGSE